LKLKKLVLFLIPLVLLLAACGNEATPSPQSQTTTGPTPAATTSKAATSATALTPATAGISMPTIAAPQEAQGDGLTMKAAYAVVSPMITAWNSKASLVAVFTPPDSEIGLDSNGRASQWFFEVFDPISAQHSTWLVKALPGGKSSGEKSIEDVLPKDRADLLESRKLPLLSTLIDTDRLMQVARENGGTKSDQPIGIRLVTPAKESDPLVFDLLFYTGDDVLRLRIDAQSGKLVENVKG
jgi:hypothetical protein